MNAKTKNRRKGNSGGRGGNQPLRTQPEKVLETDEWNGHDSVPCDVWEQTAHHPVGTGTVAAKSST